MSTTVKMFKLCFLKIHENLLGIKNLSKISTLSSLFIYSFIYRGWTNFILFYIVIYDCHEKENYCKVISWHIALYKVESITEKSLFNHLIKNLMIFLHFMRNFLLTDDSHCSTHNTTLFYHAVPNPEEEMCSNMCLLFLCHLLYLCNMTLL